MDAATYARDLSSLYDTIYIRVPKEHRPLPSNDPAWTKPPILINRKGRRLGSDSLTIVPHNVQSKRQRMTTDIERNSRSLQRQLDRMHDLILRAGMNDG